MGFNFNFDTQSSEKLTAKIKSSNPENQINKSDNPELKIQKYIYNEINNFDHYNKNNGQNQKLVCIDETVSGKNSDPIWYLTILDEKSDLIPNKYEGGKVVWECSLDLIKYFSGNPSLQQQLDLKSPVKLLELGCGQALPSIWLLKNSKNLQNIQFSEIHLQDYNSSVTEEILPTVLNANEMENFQDRIDLISGDWSDYSEKIKSKDEPKKFNLIIACECTYNEEYYDKFHKTLEAASDENTVIIISMKSHYFGPGGSYFAWEKFVTVKGVFRIEVLQESEHVLPRIIFCMRKK